MSLDPRAARPLTSPEIRDVLSNIRGPGAEAVRTVTIESLRSWCAPADVDAAVAAMRRGRSAAAAAELARAS